MKESILSIKLKEYREEHKLTQRELAEFLGVSDKSISKWELGQTYPNKTNMLQISEKLGLSIETLLLDEMIEDHPKNRVVKTNKSRYLLFASVLILCVLTTLLIQQRQTIQGQQAQLARLERETEINNQQTNRYTVSVVMNLAAGDPALVEFKRYVEDNFKVSDFTEMEVEASEGKKVLIQTFIIQAKNNALMSDYHNKIRAKVPNYLNMESHYI